MRKKKATLTGIWRLSHWDGDSSKFAEGYVALGHTAEMIATGTLRLEEEETPPAGTQQCPGAQVYEVAVTAVDGLRAQLANLLRWGRLTGRAAGADALQDRDRVAHLIATSVGHASYSGFLTPKAMGTAAVASALASSTTIRVTSGADSKMATSTAPRKVAAEDGHPSQLPKSRSLTAPSTSSMASSSTSPPWRPRKGRTDSSALFHPDVERLGMETLDQQEARHEVVGCEFGQQLWRSNPGDRGHAGEPGPVEIGDQAQQFLGQVEGTGIRGGLELGECLLDPVTARS